MRHNEHHRREVEARYRESAQAEEVYRRAMEMDEREGKPATWALEAREKERAEQARLRGLLSFFAANS